MTINFKFELAPEAAEYNNHSAAADRYLGVWKTLFWGINDWRFRISEKIVREIISDLQSTSKLMGLVEYTPRPEYYKNLDRVIIKALEEVLEVVDFDKMSVGTIEKYTKPIADFCYEAYLASEESRHAYLNR